MSDTLELKLSKPNIRLADAVGQRLVCSKEGFAQDLWLVFESGFVVIRAEGQYDGGSELGETTELKPRGNLYTLVSLGLITSEQAETWRAAKNAATEAWRVEWQEKQDRENWERLQKKYGAK